MKWIKKYEELDPYTYRRAGSNLKSIGKYKRGQKLIDYSNKISHGVYNAWVVWQPDGSSVFLYDKQEGVPKSEREYDVRGDLKINPLEFTNPKSQFDFFIDDDEKEPDNTEQLVDNWDRGKSDLGFDIHFSFEPMGSAHEAGNLRKKSSGYSNKITLFTLKFTICKPGWNRDKVYSDMYEKYKSQASFSVEMVRPFGGSHKEYYGIFSDRKSAVKFKNGIYKKVIESYHDKIFDIFSTVGADTEHLEKFMYGIKNIRTNLLYDDEFGDVLDRSNKSVNSIRPFNRWYEKDMAGRKPGKRYTPPTEEKEKDTDWEDWE